MNSPVIFSCIFGRRYLDPAVTAQTEAMLPPWDGAGKLAEGARHLPNGHRI
jgi:hypothetical protein